MPRSWKDQPAILDNLSVVCMAVVGIKSITAKIYKDTENNLYYISVGNLFGSQTAMCRDADTVFKVLSFIRSKKKGKQMPEGTVLLPNSKVDKPNNSVV